MATRPKHRKRTSATIVSSEEPSSSSAVQPDSSTPLLTSMKEDMISSCLAAITPALKETVQQCIKDFHNRPNQDTTSVADPQIALLQDLTNPPQGNSYSLPASSSISLTLGVDDKIRRSTHEGQYVKFASLLPPENEPTNKRYRSMEKEGQLIFVKHCEKNSINNITKSMEAFYIFVAVNSEKFTQEIGSLMTYAQTIQKIANTRGDQAALCYDEQFRKWEEKEFCCFPLAPINVELYQEAVVMGLDYKLQNKKPQPLRGQTKHKYCFSYNNNGFCSSGTSCPHPHVCQYCAEKHPRKHCTRQKITSSNLINIMHPPDNQLSIEHLRISKPIKVKPLAEFLEDYDENLASFLTTGFTNGFKIPNQCPRSFSLSKNLSCINGKESILHQRISKELQLQHIAGPFEHPPFLNIQVSPLGLVP